MWRDNGAGVLADWKNEAYICGLSWTLSLIGKRHLQLRFGTAESCAAVYAEANNLVVVAHLPLDAVPFTDKRWIERR